MAFVVDVAVATTVGIAWGASIAAITGYVHDRWGDA